MTGGSLYALSGALIFALALGGAILCRNLVRRVLAFNILASGAFLMLVGLGQRGGLADAVPQAMVLTGIVVAVAATALALALVRRLAQPDPAAPESSDEAGAGKGPGGQARRAVSAGGTGSAGRAGTETGE